MPCAKPSRSGTDLQVRSGPVPRRLMLLKLRSMLVGVRVHLLVPVSHASVDLSRQL